MTPGPFPKVNNTSITTTTTAADADHNYYAAPEPPGKISIYIPFPVTSSNRIAPAVTPQSIPHDTDGAKRAADAASAAATASAAAAAAGPSTSASPGPSRQGARVRAPVSYADANSPARKAAKRFSGERAREAAELVCKGVYPSAYAAALAMELPHDNQIRYHMKRLKGSGVAEALALDQPAAAGISAGFAPIPSLPAGATQQVTWVSPCLSLSHCPRVGALLVSFSHNTDNAFPHRHVFAVKSGASTASVCRRVHVGSLLLEV